jgi:GT2 family glycosyltransferase
VENLAVVSAGTTGSAVTANPRVSVVIPTFNRASLVVRAIESVRVQEIRDLEIIVVDDGSTDGTAAELDRLAAVDPRIVPVHQPNAGVVAARNRGLARATGTYIALLDSDDEWYPWKLAAQLAILDERPDVGMCWSDMTAVDASADVVAERFLRRMYTAYRLLDEESVFPERASLDTYTTAVPTHAAGAPVRIGHLYPSIIAGNLVHTSTVVLRRDWARAVGGFDPDLGPSGEDHDFHLRTARLGPVALLDTPTIAYRVGAADQLSRPDLDVVAARNFRSTIDKAVAAHEGDPLRNSLIRRARAEAHCWLAEIAIESGEYVTGISHATRSVVSAPMDRRRLRTAARAVKPPILRRLRPSRRLGLRPAQPPA